MATAEALAHEQEGSVDEALRIALRAIGEGAVLMEKMALDAFRAGTAAGATFEERAQEHRQSAALLGGAMVRS
jgi:two-component system chemotaxis response regulator CheB